MGARRAGTGAGGGGGGGKRNTSEVPIKMRDLDVAFCLFQSRELINDNLRRIQLQTHTGTDGGAHAVRKFLPPSLPPPSFFPEILTIQAPFLLLYLTLSFLLFNIFNQDTETRKK